MGDKAPKQAKVQLIARDPLWYLWRLLALRLACDMQQKCCAYKRESTCEYPMRSRGRGGRNPDTVEKFVTRSQPRP